MSEIRSEVDKVCVERAAVSTPGVAIISRFDGAPGDPSLAWAWWITYQSPTVRVPQGGPGQPRFALRAVQKLGEVEPVKIEHSFDWPTSERIPQSDLKKSLQLMRAIEEIVDTTCGLDLLSTMQMSCSGSVECDKLK